MRYQVAILTAVGLALCWAVIICWFTFVLEMRLGQNHLRGNDPLVKRGAWSPDPKFKDAETRTVVLTHVWFTMVTNQRRTPPNEITAYGDIKITFRPALWGAIAASLTVPVGLAFAAARRNVKTLHAHQPASFALPDHDVNGPDGRTALKAPPGHTGNRHRA